VLIGAGSRLFTQLFLEKTVFRLHCVSTTQVSLYYLLYLILYLASLGKTKRPRTVWNNYYYRMWKTRAFSCSP